MKVLPVILLIVLGVSFLSCEKDTSHTPALPLSESLAGNWLVVQHTLRERDFSYENKRQGLVTHWGGHYIHSLAIYADGRFYINDSQLKPASGIDQQPSGGTWVLQGNRITFHWDKGSFTIFEAAITKEGSLRLENNELTLTHNKRL